MINPNPRWRLTAIRLGAVISVLALLASSFAKTVSHLLHSGLTLANPNPLNHQPWQLLCTQGLAYSFGGSIVYYPTFSFLSEWFITRRGFANGVCFAGTAAGGLVYPFVLEALLSRYGAEVTLQALVSCRLLNPRSIANGPTGRHHCPSSRGVDASPSTSSSSPTSRRSHDS